MYKLMKIITLFLCVAAAVAAPASPAPGPKITTIDKIVVFVNKGVITSVQVDAQMAQVIENLKTKHIPLPNTSDLRKQVIEQLIMQQIQLDLAAKSGIKVSDLETTTAIENIAKQQHMDLEQLKVAIQKQGMTFDGFRQQIKTQIIVDKLKQREVNARINVSEDEVNRVLSSEAYKQKVDYNLSDIVVSIPEQASEGVVREKAKIADLAYQALKSGQSFAQVAIKYSNAPNALTGGELGWRSSGALPPIMVQGVEGLTAGDFTQVIHLPSGFFILKINGIKHHGSPQIVHQYHVYHILVKVNEGTSDDDAHQKILMIKSLLDKDGKNTAKVDEDFMKYAKQYSEDTSSINGGDLGWISRGDTVPAFEHGVINTKIGVVSQPIKSPFGWHLLQVRAVRDSNLAEDKEKAEIRQELREVKGAIMYTQWLRDIREMSYVKFNDE